MDNGLFSLQLIRQATKLDEFNLTVHAYQKEPTTATHVTILLNDLAAIENNALNDVSAPPI